MVAIVGAAAASRRDPRILLVKTSSLGDVVHNLPVVSDLRAHFPDAKIDWLVEENFAAIPRLHPGVDEVLPVAVRRWRKNLLTATSWREIVALRRRLKQTAYDVVLDTQGLAKSALLANWAKGPHHGYAADSIREPLAARFYDQHHHISKALHAVERNRRLAAVTFGYALPASLDYGIQAEPLQAEWLGVGQPYAVLLTATSRDDKLWPEAHWIELGRQLVRLGIGSVLPGGSSKELERAARIATAFGGIAPPALDIPTLARLMSGAKVVIGVDTGLTHLAAALGRPTLAIFCATNPGLTGVVAPQPVLNLGGIDQAPAPEEVLHYCRTWL